MPGPTPRTDGHGGRTTFPGVQARPVGAGAAAGGVPGVGRSGAPPARTAVVVCHGMGQQVPFETLDVVARGLAEAEWREHRREVAVRTNVAQLVLADGTIKLPRVELELTDAASGQQDRSIHLYEAYWAPLMEGKADARDVLDFLFRGGRRGVWNAFGWCRWALGATEEHTSRVTAALLAFAHLVVLSILLINATIAAMAAARLTFGTPSSWPGPVLLGDLTMDALLLIVGEAALLGLGIGLPAGWRAWLTREGKGRRVPEPERLACWGLVCVAFVLPILVALMMGLRLLGVGLPWNRWFTASLGMPPAAFEGWTVPTTVVWGLLFYGSWKARGLLVQYLGDVAAYVDAYTVDKFWDVRRAIKDESLRVARAVYDARRRGGTAFRYERVIVVGHSLGSVVAYDTLNALINDDVVARRAGARGLDVVRRTPLFLTFGSPLDKTAFIFTTQRSTSLNVREALAAAVQPMILKYAYRPERWVNIWSPSDPISGSLDFYDPKTGDDPKRVQNVRDRDATTPLLAHTEYWSNPRLQRVLYGELTGYDEPEDWPSLSGGDPGPGDPEGPVSGLAGGRGSGQPA